MNKKIVIAGFFIAILFMSQFSAAIPIDRTYGKKNLNLLNDYSIALSGVQYQRLMDSVDNISDVTLRNELQSILDSSLTYVDQINSSVLHELLVILSDYYPTNTNEIYDFLDLIEAILEIIISHIKELPVLIVQALLYDVIMIAQQIEEIVNDVIGIINFETLGDLFSGISSLFGDFNTLIYHVRQLPKNMDDLKIYVEDKIRSVISAVLEDIVEETSDVVWEFTEPRLGYISKFGVEIYNTYLVSEEFIEHLTFKLEHFKIIFIDLPKAYISFKNANEQDRIPTLINFSVAIGNALGSARVLFRDLTDNETEILNDITELMGHLDYLNSYYQSEPWKLPITIQGNVVNTSGQEVVISFIDPSQSDQEIITGENASFILYYNTSNLERQFGLHTFTIIASCGDKTLEFNRSAFSDAFIEMKIDFNEEDRVHQSFGRDTYDIHFLENLKNIFFRFFLIYNF